jgi:hypothetical protein
MLLVEFLGTPFITVLVVTGTVALQEMIKAQMKPHKTVSVRSQAVVLETLQTVQGQETAEGLVLCDQCSARAFVKVSFPAGILTFCMHHYNNHAQALTEKGAVAKLLNV